MNTDIKYTHKILAKQAQKHKNKKRTTCNGQVNLLQVYKVDWYPKVINVMYQ